MNKRKDAQGLRGWAVLLVILFQFYPVVFPNSFIGLDIYFVTAGFIVAIILSRYDSFNIDNAKEFLLKRAQRILPMYYIAMILILLVVGVALPLSYKKLNLETARKSVFLTANFYNREPGEGFLQLDGEDMNSHLWSLCLELQAYLIIPFAVLLQKRISQNATAFFSGMMVLSMLFHFSTSEPLFHKCVFSRLWQFFAGFLAFSIGDKGHKPEFDGTDFKSVDQLAGSNVKQLDDEPVIVNYVKSLGFVVMIFAAVVPIPIDVDSLRLVMTFSTAAILHCNGEDVKMLSNPLMTHIGDMSLVLYLAHVPVYVVVEFYSEYIFCPFPLGILITFMLAIISNQYVECIFFKLSASNVLKISFCLFIATLILSW